MQTSGGNQMGGAPHHMNSNVPVINPVKPVGSAGELRFDEIILESNEVDLADLQAS